MDLALCKQEKFNGVLVDFYRDENNDVFMTREQIGRALEYKNPNDSIRTIHRRNKERLNKFAVSFKLNATDGKNMIQLYIILVVFMRFVATVSNQKQMRFMIGYMKY